MLSFIENILKQLTFEPTPWYWFMSSFFKWALPGKMSWVWRQHLPTTIAISAIRTGSSQPSLLSYRFLPKNTTTGFFTWWSDFRLWRFRLKDLSIDEMVGAWCFDCFSGPPGVYMLDLFLLRYSVLFTVESLSLLYLLVISWFICSRRWCIDKLGVFHAKQISMYLDPYLN